MQNNPILINNGLYSILSRSIAKVVILIEILKLFIILELYGYWSLMIFNWIYNRIILI